MSSRADKLRAWLEDISGTDWIWFLKYLAANDTTAKTNVHQAGPYVGKELLKIAFPKLLARSRRVPNPDIHLPVAIESHGLDRTIRVVWYNSRVLARQPNGRDEARMTGWGGRSSPLLDPEATGSLVLFAYELKNRADATGCFIWICSTAQEEDILTETVGPVEPGVGLIHSPSGRYPSEKPRDVDKPCHLQEKDIPASWKKSFPPAELIVKRVVESLASAKRQSPDDRLLNRRVCEFTMFRSLENVLVLPRLREGFADVDVFVEYAHSVTNRRKARSGRSLELQAKAVLDEEGVPYSWGKPTEGKKTPDFIFPSVERYHDPRWSAKRLRMLAAKTTCKDRWRQILNEADRVPGKHLLTLQEGVSETQFAEMQRSHVTLVVPEKLVNQYPKSVKSHLMTFGAFIQEVKRTC